MLHPRLPVPRKSDHTKETSTSPLPLHSAGSPHSGNPARGASLGASLPTSVGRVERKSSMARSQNLNRLFPLPGSHLCPQDLLGLSSGRFEMFPRLRPVPTPPPLSGGPILRPVQVPSGEAVTSLQLVEPRGEPLGAIATVPSGFCVLGILYFFLEARPPAHWRASAHFFSEISRLRRARDLGGAVSYVPPPGLSSLAIPHRGRLAPPPRAWPVRRHSRFLGPHCAPDGSVRC